MAGFDAGSVVEPLHCKLKPYADFDADIPEPSTIQVQEFVNARNVEIERVRARAKDLPDDATAEQLAAILPPDVIEADRRRSAEIYSAVCSGKPSADDLMKLPHREFQVFTAWLLEELLNPEAAAGAGNSRG